MIFLYKKSYKKAFKKLPLKTQKKAIFRELSDGKYEFVEFMDIGTHSQLY